MKIQLVKNEIEEIELTEKEEAIYKQGKSDGGLICFLWFVFGFVVFALIMLI